jgi:phage terminase small subunit
MAKLTDKQRRFVDEYCIDLNATRAAIRAGYSEKTARSIGDENLTKPDIKTAIDAALEKIHNANVANAQEVEEYLTRVLRGESMAEIVIVESVGDGCSNARRISKLPDERERLKAAELLAKRYGMLTDKTKIEGGVQVVVYEDLDG